MDQQKLSSKIIKVNNLPFSTTDEQFQNLFKDFEIESAQILKKKGRSKGVGFVHLLKESDQKPLIEKINNIELEHRRLLATIAYEPKESETILYVSNIPWSYGNEEFKNLFKEYDVKSATVVLSRTGRSRGFGFVEFNTTEDQQRALKLDETKVEERVITVRVSKKDEEWNSTSSSKENSPIKGNTNKEYTLVANNLPYDLDENDMLQIFADFNVKAANIPTRNGRSKGFGYVEFSNATDMNNAMVALDQSVINDRLVEVKLAIDKPYKGEKEVKSVEYRSKNTNNIRNKNRPKKELSQTILHVSNLPYSFDDNQLSTLFSDFKVVKSNIVKNLNGTSAGHAFVEFESHDEQQRAYKAKNRNLIDGRKFFLQPSWN